MPPPPMPWTARQMINHVMFCAAPHNAEPSFVENEYRVNTVGKRGETHKEDEYDSIQHWLATCEI